MLSISFEKELKIFVTIGMYDLNIMADYSPFFRVGDLIEGKRSMSEQAEPP